MKRPFKVVIQDEKPVVVEPVLPIDPVQRVRYQATPQFGVQVREEQNRSLHLSHYPTFHIDGQIVRPIKAKLETYNVPLAKTPGGKERFGFQSVYVHGDLRMTLTAEVVPSRPADRVPKRRLDTVLVRYALENKGKQAHKVGARVYMDINVIENDGALFAAPTVPGKLLDGIELKGKTLADYVQVLEKPDLKNPGFVAHLTLNVGGGMEKADRVVLTEHGGGPGWDLPVQQANGDSALAMFWDIRELKAGAKREIAYAYGQGLAMPVENEGRLNLQLAGSFEPGKLFSITAGVADPLPGQVLTLHLPAGMERVEGKEAQPVLALTGAQTQSIVLWKARVLRTGQFPIRLTSSSGVTQTKIVTISGE